MMDRPITTLFLIESLDGKINSGSTDDLDVDRDWCTIDGVKEGLHQYYEIEETTDSFSLNTGRVMAKIGINERQDSPYKMSISFVLIDNKPHLTLAGVNYLCKWVNHLYVITTNFNHPAYSTSAPNITIIKQEQLDLKAALVELKQKYGVERITLQSGGTLNCELLRHKLIDYVDIIIAPLLVGGKDTTTLIDGPSITKVSQLNQLQPLQLLECKVLADSYIRLRYKAIK